ncbi:MAG TPA: sigma-70 family RNA polymerase sigma factor [Microlunatus sp.]|nr:sigma-70 family RNA polymerase sigma factor [Microlunatus sp.]
MSIPKDRSTLLSATDEAGLARRIEAGVLAEAVLAGSLALAKPAAAGDAELRWLVHDGRQAHQRFVQANLRLVAMVAAQHAQRANLSLGELFQDGCVGLLLAIQRYDHRRGCRFATYALFWIRAVIGATSARSRGAAELPVRRAEELRALRGLEAELSQRHGRPPTVTELAEAAGRSTGWVAGLSGYEAPRSLEELGEVELADALDQDPAERHGMDGAARELLWHLLPFEREVVARRMGFLDGRAHSYAEVARDLRMSVSRVRRIEERALDRLRAVCPHEARALLR